MFSVLKWKKAKLICRGRKISHSLNQKGRSLTQSSPGYLNGREDVSMTRRSSMCKYVWVAELALFRVGKEKGILVFHSSSGSFTG